MQITNAAGPSISTQRARVGAGRGFSSSHTAAADASRSAEPTPAAIASPSVNALWAAISRSCALSAGSVAAASCAAPSVSFACETSSVPGGISIPRYTLATIEPSTAIPSAMPSS